MLRTQGFQVSATQCVDYAEIIGQYNAMSENLKRMGRRSSLWFQQKVPVAGSWAVLLLLNCANAHQKLKAVLAENHSTSFSATFGEESFYMPYDRQYQDFLIRRLTTELNSGIDLAASRCQNYPLP